MKAMIFGAVVVIAAGPAAAYWGGRRVGRSGSPVSLLRRSAPDRTRKGTESADCGTARVAYDLRSASGRTGKAAFGGRHDAQRGNDPGLS